MPSFAAWQALEQFTLCSMPQSDLYRQLRIDDGRLLSGIAVLFTSCTRAAWRAVQVQPFQQLDLAERRRKRELQEICEAAAKKGVKSEVKEPLHN